MPLIKSIISGGRNNIDDIRTIPSELLHRIEFDVLVYRELSPQDGIDTLIALRNSLKPKKNQWVNELIGDFKKLADKQRPQLKKFLNKISQ